MDRPPHRRQRVYQLRAQLRRISPPVWRRLLVPVEATIRALHDTLQAAMGWEDCHCHAFTIRGQSYGVPRPGGIGFYSSPDHLRLADFDFRAHERFAYTYGFHCHWIHDIRIERLPDRLPAVLPHCVGGKGRCPPEDSGPAERFMERLDGCFIDDFFEWLAEAVRDGTPMAEVRREILEQEPWLERRFDRQAANGRLHGGG